MSFLKNTLKIMLTIQHSKTSQILVQNRSIKRWVAPTLRELRKRKEKIRAQEPQPRSSFTDWNYEAEMYAFSKRLQENINGDRLQIAFVNRSYILNEEKRQRELGIDEPNIELTDNSILISKGEKLVNEYVKAFVAFSLPKLPTNGILEIVNYLTKEDTLSHISSHIGIKDLALCSVYPPDSKTLRDTFLAVIGALHESTGDEKTFTFIRDFICTQLNQKDLGEIWNIPNSFETLKNLYKDQNLGEIEQRLIGDSAKNTVLATYHIGIYSQKNLIGKGFGEDIHTATETASLDALHRYYGICENMTIFDFNIEFKRLISQYSQKQLQ